MESKKVVRYEDLPQEILVEVFLYLPTTDLVSLMVSSKSLNSIVDSNIFWRLLCQRFEEVKTSDLVDMNKDYKKIFRKMHELSIARFYEVGGRCELSENFRKYTKPNGLSISWDMAYVKPPIRKTGRTTLKLEIEGNKKQCFDFVNLGICTVKEKESWRLSLNIHTGSFYSTTGQGYHGKFSKNNREEYQTKVIEALYDFKKNRNSEPPRIPAEIIVDRNTDTVEFRVMDVLCGCVPLAEGIEGFSREESVIEFRVCLYYVETSIKICGLSHEN